MDAKRKSQSLLALALSRVGRPGPPGTRRRPLDGGATSVPVVPNRPQSGSGGAATALTFED